MYPVAKMALDEEARQATAIQKPRRRKRAGLAQEPKGGKRAGLIKEPMSNKRVPLFRRKWFKGAPAGEHGAGSRVERPDAFAVSPSLREGWTWRFESSIPG